MPKRPTSCTEEVLVRLEPSVAKRMIGVAVLLGLGVLLFWLVLAFPPAALVWRIFLVFLGVGALFQSWQIWRVGTKTLELTRTELREAGGRRLAAVSDMAAVHRGAFSLKPSNGFRITLKTKAPAAWAPGLWWRFGHQLGIGGTTPRQATRNMADILTLLLRE